MWFSYSDINCGASSDFVSSSIPSWQIFTAHAQPFRGARDLVFCLKVPLDSLLVLASSGGSGETARMRRLAWTFAARISDKYQIRLTRPILSVQTHFTYLIHSKAWCACNSCGMVTIFIFVFLPVFLISSYFLTLTLSHLYKKAYMLSSRSSI